MFVHKYDDTITLETLLSTWQRFLRRKRHKKDVITFEAKLSENILNLYFSLKNKTYIHGPYSAFNISDPKPRNIHKASVRDRLLHHFLYRELYPYFDDKFIYDSYSCRKYKGTHRALDRFRFFAGKVSKNNTRTCYVLKCDIRKFFASIDQEILMKILTRHIADHDFLWLIHQVVSSFYTTRPSIGMPLGNLTSQLLVNVYMHEFDMFMKQELCVKYYIRYADDFVVLSDDITYLQNLTPRVDTFLRDRLHLNLHPDKVYIATYASGIDFLGWIHFPHYRQIRTSTKRKIIRNLAYYPKPETVSSYRGLLGHGDTYLLKKRVGMVIQ
jgi:retron-type reverse transcriptase